MLLQASSASPGIYDPSLLFCLSYFLLGIQARWRRPTRPSIRLHAHYDGGRVASKSATYGQQEQLAHVDVATPSLGGAFYDAYVRSSRQVGGLGRQLRGAVPRYRAPPWRKRHMPNLRRV
jgi:hypothetical protein